MDNLVKINCGISKLWKNLNDLYLWTGVYLEHLNTLVLYMEYQENWKKVKYVVYVTNISILPNHECTEVFHLVEKMRGK
jgi:hypothetical protein